MNMACLLSCALGEIPEEIGESELKSAQHYFIYNECQVLILICIKSDSFMIIYVILFAHLELDPGQLEVTRFNASDLGRYLFGFLSQRSSPHVGLPLPASQIKDIILA